MFIQNVQPPKLCSNDVRANAIVIVFRMPNIGFSSEYRIYLCKDINDVSNRCESLCREFLRGGHLRINMYKEKISQYDPEMCDGNGNIAAEDWISFHIKRFADLIEGARGKIASKTLRRLERSVRDFCPFESLSTCALMKEWIGRIHVQVILSEMLSEEFKRCRNGWLKFKPLSLRCDKKLIAKAINRINRLEDGF